MKSFLAILLLCSAPVMVWSSFGLFIKKSLESIGKEMNEIEFTNLE